MNEDKLTKINYEENFAKFIHEKQNAIIKTFSKNAVETLPEDVMQSMLEDYDNSYFVNNNPIVEDSFYDEFKKFFKTKYPNNPYNTKIGSDLSDTSAWVKVKHKYPMPSIDDRVNKAMDFIKIMANRIGHRFRVDYKYDGISLELVYVFGHLRQAITRGDGETGEDISRNALKFKGVPRTISEQREVHIRGEIIIVQSDYDSVVSDVKKNKRNTAGGIAKRYSGFESEKLTFVAYHILNHNELELNTADEIYTFLHNISGLNVAEMRFIDNDPSLIPFYAEEVYERRDRLDFDIDGLVVRDCDNSYMIAYKFPSQTAETILLDVIHQYDGGWVTPVAVIEPVEICGATISRASLYNYSDIKEKGLMIGDTVIVSRRNDVIPCIEMSVSHAVDGIEIKPPENCPKCGAKLEYEKTSDGTNLVYLTCVNSVCPSKLVRRIMKWIEAHNAKGIGKATVEFLIQHKICDSLVTFLQIPKKYQGQYLSIEGLGAREKSFDIIKNAIEESIPTDIVMLMDAMDIRGLGKRRTEDLLKYMTDKVNEPVEIDDFIGFITGDFQDDEIKGYKDEIKWLITSGVNDVTQRKVDNLFDIVEAIGGIDVYESPATGNLVQGLSFCFTGALVKFTRDEIKQKVIEQGGIVKDGVSKNLDFLVTNELSLSSKSKKAIEQGVKVITENELLTMLGEYRS
jgi:DNA ligase (NAD+)